MEDKLIFDTNPDGKYFAMLKPLNIKNTSFFYIPNKLNKIGRSNECDIIFTHPSISKVHALLEFCENGDVVLRDLNSSNGCYVNDQILKDGMPIFINNYDKIKFGKDLAVYQIIINENFRQKNDKKFEEMEERNKLASNGFSGNDERISLVNLEVINKARRNHFENNLNFKSDLNNVNNYDFQMNQNNTGNTANFNNNEEYKRDINNHYNRNGALNNQLKMGNSNSNSRSIRESNIYSNSPKFNNSLEGDNQEFNITFKNGKNPLRNRSEEEEKKGNIQNEIVNNIYEEIQNRMQEHVDFFKNEKIKFEKRNLEVEKILSDKNEEIKSMQETIAKNSQEFTKLNSKHNGLLLYASDLQKKLENIEIDLLENHQEIQKFKSSEWGKLLSEKDQIIKILQNELLFYKNEMNKVKSLLGVNSKNIASDLAKRVDNLIDGYISENKKYKRIVEEYKSKEDQCSKKWSELLKENNSNKEKINFLNRQISDQAEQFNSFMAENDRKLVEAIIRVQNYLENFDVKKAEAAEYLVKQMNSMMEERRKLTEDNIILDNKISVLKFEFDKMREENKSLNEFFMKDMNNFNSNNINVVGSINSNFNSNSIINQLKLKIEELEDLVAQHNCTMDPFKISDLEHIITEINREISVKNTLIENLNLKIKDILSKPNFIFDEKQAVFSLSQAMREKDVLILDLKKALRDAKEKEYKIKIDDNMHMHNYQLSENNIKDLYQNYQYGIDKNHPDHFIEKIENLSEENSII